MEPMCLHRSSNVVSTCQASTGHCGAPSGNSSKSTEKAPSMGAQATSSMGRTVSPSVASKKGGALGLLPAHIAQGSHIKQWALSMCPVATAKDCHAIPPGHLAM